MKALNRDSLILLLDGFDELGSQSWSSDEGRLRQMRARALSGVKDLVSKTRLGCLIAGREHYFSSNDEMVAALGLNKNNSVIVKVKDEFNELELDKYFDSVGIDAELPSWLPRKPLICQTIALLSDNELGSMFGITSDGASFWNHFIKIVCQRDARINAVFDAETIYSVFVSLSRITRTRSANVGPISQRDLQEAFEDVVGQLPVDEASAMLQRLPSLGRIGAESQDRQFVDMFILDGLRAKDVALLPERDESRRKQIFLEKWTNPLGPLGQAILANDTKDRIDTFKQIASRASKSQNATLAGDIVGSFTKISGGPIIFNNLNISGASINEMDFNSTQIDGINFDQCTFEKIILPKIAPKDIRISGSLCNKVTGAASYTGLPSWIKLDIVDEFDTVQTVSQIRKAGLSPAHEILVAVLKKTFNQKGAGRKEEAMLRGFGGGASKKIANSILSMLMRENIIDRHKGDEGWIYSPNRNHGSRIKLILEQLRSSQDVLWLEVEKLN